MNPIQYHTDRLQTVTGDFLSLANSLFTDLIREPVEGEPVGPLRFLVRVLFLSNQKN